ncbi:hypothetical protein J3R82DRAFT_11565 [Butyriboletus roseoflavus]|nr:hypothetical protein J3R82DRAFT_11565 [Butyriboletus roseoflavus]
MARLTRHRCIPGDKKSKPSSGLLSHVFSFVSQEIESFVLNATAGPVNQPGSTGRVKSSGRRRGRDSERNMSEDDARYKSRTQRHRERGRRFKPEPSRPQPRSKSSDFTRKYRLNHSQPTYIDDDDRVLSASDRERSKSPTPRPPSVFLAPPPPKLKKQPSMTMPGSLFPRSPSLVPDQPVSYQRTRAVPDVHISVQPSRPPYVSDSGEAEAGPSWTHSSTVPSADSTDPNQHSLDQYASPWRTRSVASVKDAVHRFNATEGAEADFSLMLPSPHSSPVKPVSKAHSVDEASPHRPSSSFVPKLSSRKGKERARDSGNDEDLDFIVCGNSGHDGVYAKERELNAAREEQREHEKRLSGDQSRRASDERDRDKQRIKALEEEVRRLKEELSRSQLRSSLPSSFSPPPPPPPPPPVPLRIDTTPYTPTSMFASARASLRHAMTPVEAPINNPGLTKTKRHGQPTVNVPSEKMAAFLHEIKTAKLRRVGSGTNAMGGDGAAGPSGLSKSVSVTSSASTGPSKLSAKELLRRRSLASLRVPIGSSLAAPVPLSALATPKEPEVRVGQKRKADTLVVDEVNGVPRMSHLLIILNAEFPMTCMYTAKRRMTQSSFQPSAEMSQHTTASSSELSTLSSLSLPPHSQPTNETDIATPSLCSDNDRDENSIEDRVPSTPPGPRATTTTQKASKTDTHEEQIEVIDVDMEEHSHTEPRTISPSSVPRRTSDLFKMRPPTSPIPIPTPRRPSAPARTKRGATPKPKSLLFPESDVDDGDEASSQSAPVPFISLIPVAKSKPTKRKTKPTLTGKGRPRTASQQNGHLSTPSGLGSSSQSKRKKAHKRRQTLDEEIRTAEARSLDIDQCNDEPDPEEEDVFIATGTKSKRKGFLAHGGGGGAPVFMGAGYIQGVVLDSTDEDGVIGTQPRRSSKSGISRKKLAAVLVLLYEQGGELRVLLTTRSKLLREHPGQTALPGGKANETDADLVYTAFREAQEEVGLPLGSPDIHTLCTLQPFLSHSQLIVTPVVALLTDPAILCTLKPCVGEVDHIFNHPLEAILDPSLSEKEPLVPSGSEHWPYSEEFYVCTISLVCGDEVASLSFFVTTERE